MADDAAQPASATLRGCFATLIPFIAKALCGETGLGAVVWHFTGQGRAFARPFLAPGTGRYFSLNRVADDRRNSSSSSPLCFASWPGIRAMDAWPSDAVVGNL
jgi:hypothetical protein